MSWYASFIATAGAATGLLLVLLGGCADIPPSHLVARTPYDSQLNSLNQRLCLKQGGRWTFVIERDSIREVCEGKAGMTPVQALSRALLESRRFTYRPDAQRDGREIDFWETPAEVEAKGGADCDGLSVWMISRTYALNDALNGASQPLLRLVAGTVGTNFAVQGHAWVELVVDGQRWWADPTQFSGPWRAEEYTDRHPLYAYTYDGVTFSAKRAYGPHSAVHEASLLSSHR